MLRTQGRKSPFRVCSALSRKLASSGLSRPGTAIRPPTDHSGVFPQLLRVLPDFRLGKTIQNCKDFLAALPGGVQGSKAFGNDVQNRGLPSLLPRLEKR